MAALQKIRSKSGLLVGIIAVGLLAFVFPWGEVTTFVNKVKDKAFVVDGEVINTKAYSDRVNEYESFQKFMTGQNSLDETTSLRIREEVYQQMVKETILDKEAEKLGLAVTSGELNDMVYGQNMAPLLYQIPLFANPQTGQFDRTILTQFLSTVNQDMTGMENQQKEQIMAYRQMWAFIQNMIKYQRLEEKYTSLVSGSFLTNDSQIKATQEDTKNVADIAYVIQRYSTISDSTVQVTDQEIKELYNQRKNNYKLNSELRKISYFIKDVVPSDEDYTAVENEINAVYEKLKTAENPTLLVNEYSANQYIDVNYTISSLPANIKVFVESANVGDIQPPAREDQSFVTYKVISKANIADSVKLQIIPIPQAVTPAAAIEYTDSLQAVIKGGKDFAEIAEEIYPGSQGGSVGWVNEISLLQVNMPANQIFAASKGEVLNLSVNGQNQLIRIEDKTNPVSKVKLAIVEMPVIVSDKTQNTIDNELNMFVAESGNLENFDKAALDKGYNIMPNITVSPSELSLGQATGTRQVIGWAFNNKIGEVKKFDLSDKRIVAIIRKDITGDYMPVSEVATSLKAELRNQKKAELMIADLKAKSYSSLPAYADGVQGKVDTVNFVTFQTNNITGIGYEPLMNVYSKIGQTGKLSEPLKGKNGVYVLNVVDKKDNSTEFNLDQTKMSIKQNEMYQLTSQALIVLRDKMGIEDNRIRFW
jgi:peptidyl-prolyl cis-trans isomerase D